MAAYMHKAAYRAHEMLQRARVALQCFKHVHTLHEMVLLHLLHQIAAILTIYFDAGSDDHRMSRTEHTLYVWQIPERHNACQAQENVLHTIGLYATETVTLV